MKIGGSKISFEISWSFVWPKCRIIVKICFSVQISNCKSAVAWENMKIKQKKIYHPRNKAFLIRTTWNLSCDNILFITVKLSTFTKNNFSCLRGISTIGTIIRHRMTSLFAYKVAQPTKWRFLPKNLNQLVIFVIGVVLWVDKNRTQFQKTNYFKKLSYQKMVLL